MNLLTFDIEEWYDFMGSNKSKEFDRYLDAILNKLDDKKCQATFFCVGEMGRLFPKVIRKIHTRGHEIGCHSNVHAWLNKMTEQECREDTRRAVDSLEQCIGKKVESYRAPAFSISENNKWAFEILAENGIKMDASIFPASRDFGGFSNFGAKTPCVIEYNGIRLKEFPICMTKLFGKEMAYSGGGYFRFFPYGYIKKTINNSEYSMCYFHIGDLIPDSQGVMSKVDYESYFKEPGTLKARYIRFFKANFGKKDAFGKMMKLIDEIEFVGLRESDYIINWEKVPVVNLF